MLQPAKRTALRALTIHKFGGAALADATAIARVATLLDGFQASANVVVASAMLGVTERLVALALRASSAGGELVAREFHELLEAHEREAAALLATAPSILMHARDRLGVAFDEIAAVLSDATRVQALGSADMDRIASLGERASAVLVTAALEAAGHRARLVPATDVLCTDGRFGNASPDLEATTLAASRVLEPLLDAGVTPVVPGFFGRNADGQITTLGRGGSDLTATVLARCLQADEVVLWKDVPGLFTADPRVVPTARRIPRLDRREAGELAYYGARVLHPRAMIPLGSQTNVIIRSFKYADNPGTVIEPRTAARGALVRGLTAISDQAMLTVAGNGMLGVPGIAARTFGAIARAGLSVTLITQASSEHSISLAVPAAGADAARRALYDAFSGEIARGEIDGVELRSGLAIVAAVGLGMARTPGVAARIFGALARAGVNVVAIAQGSSELNISVVVEGTEADDAQRAIHDAFHLGKLGGGRVAARRRSDVVLLGLGRIGRELVRQIAALGHDRRSDVRVVGIIDRSGYVFDPRGLSARRLDALALRKERGEPIASAPGARRASAAEAVQAISDYALARPILVDVSASDTGAVLLDALASGFDLVLANKVPLAADRETAEVLLHRAHERGRRVYHEATVGAGLPIMDAIEKLVASGDRVRSIEGCPSGTLGYLFSELAEGRRFSEALRDAMVLGYTEPDPRDDLSGRDVGRKALILGRMLGFRGEFGDIALESLVPPSLANVPLDEFLSRLRELDEHWRRRVQEATASGGVLRYRVRATSQSVEARLVAVPARSSLASLRGTDNQFAFSTVRYRDTPLIIMGPGAGPGVTAAGVLNDVLRAARTRGAASVRPSPRQRSEAPREPRLAPGRRVPSESALPARRT